MYQIDIDGYVYNLKHRWVRNEPICESKQNEDGVKQVNYVTPSITFELEDYTTESKPKFDSLLKRFKSFKIRHPNAPYPIIFDYEGSKYKVEGNKYTFFSGGFLR